MKKFIYCLLFLPLLCITSYSQTTPPPNTQPPPESFPEYIVKPSEDLNPYGLSSLESSTGNEYREGAGTLGTKLDGRPSNREVNKRAEEKRAENQSNKNPQQNQAVEEIVVDDDVAVENFSGTPSSGSSSMIRWVDDQGVTHITNNIGSVPAKYRDQIK